MVALRPLWGETVMLRVRPDLNDLRVQDPDRGGHRCSRWDHMPF